MGYNKRRISESEQLHVADRLANKLDTRNNRKGIRRALTGVAFVATGAVAVLVPVAGLERDGRKSDVDIVTDCAEATVSQRERVFSETPDFYTISEYVANCAMRHGIDLNDAVQTPINDNPAYDIAFEIYQNQRLSQAD